MAPPGQLTFGCNFQLATTAIMRRPLTIAAASVLLLIGNGIYSAAQSQATWTAYRWADAEFEVRFPSRPELTQLGDGAVRYQATTIGVERLVLQVQTGEVEPTTLDDAASGLKQGLTGNGARVVSETRTTIAGCPAREMIVQNPGFFARTQLTLIGKRFFIIGVAGRTLALLQSSDANTFLASFRPAHSCEETKPIDDTKLKSLGNSVVVDLLDEKTLIAASHPRPPTTHYDRFTDVTVNELPLSVVAGDDPVRSAVGAGVASALLGIRVPPTIDAIYAYWSTEFNGNVIGPKAKTNQAINLIVVSIKATARFEGDRELILLIDGDTRVKLGPMKKLDQRSDSGLAIETLGLAISFSDVSKIAQAQSLEAKIGPSAFTFEGGYLSNLRDYFRALQ